MTRKLASIRKIDAIRPIPDADAIECAVLGGWTVVVKKNEFKAGDLAIYCEIDSWIPHDLAPFLSKGQEPREFEGIRGERLRTVKLRGQLSQGLLLPLFEPNFLISKFAEVENVANRPYPVWVENITKEGWYFEDRNYDQFWIGLDVSEYLGIVKYEAPIPAQLAGEAKGMFPGWIPKTDQERIQNLATELATWTKDRVAWEITEKLDGSSMTAYYRDGEVGVCSRNLDLRDTESNTLWRVAHRDGIITVLTDLKRNLAIQGELIGEGIQGNPYRIRGQSFYVFDIYDIDAGSYMLPGERQQFCEDNELLHVPVLMNQITDVNTSMEGLLGMAEGASELNEKTEREGLVFKAMDQQASFKAISNRFLLKGGN